MRKFANITRIEERQKAEKAGLSIAEFRKREYEIAKAWAAASKEGVNQSTPTFDKERAAPKPKRRGKDRRAPEMVSTQAKKQYWNGTEWVKLDEKEPVHV